MNVVMSITQTRTKISGMDKRDKRELMSEIVNESSHTMSTSFTITITRLYNQGYITTLLYLITSDWIIKDKQKYYESYHFEIFLLLFYASSDSR